MAKGICSACKAIVDLNEPCVCPVCNTGYVHLLVAGGHLLADAWGTDEPLVF